MLSCILNMFTFQEQRMVAQKISELKLEESEHKLVIDALKEVNDPTRKYVYLNKIFQLQQLKSKLNFLYLHVGSTSPKV